MTHGHHTSGSSGKVLAFLAGAATTAAIGGYLLYGPQGARNRRTLDTWVAKAKAEVLERMQEAGEMTEEAYHRIVDEVSERYGRMRDIGSHKAGRLASKLKSRFSDMKREAEAARDDALQELDLDQS